MDLAAEFDPAVRMDLFRLTALERRIAEIRGRRVLMLRRVRRTQAAAKEQLEALHDRQRADLLSEPVEKPRLRANTDRDRRLASRHGPAASMAVIIENAERVEGYVAAMDRRTFEQDGRTREPVERCLERIARPRIAWASMRRRQTRQQIEQRLQLTDW